MSLISNLFSLSLQFFKSRCLSHKDYNRASNSWHWQVSSGNHVSKWSTACCSSPPSSLVSLTRCRLGTGTSIRLLPPTAQCRYRQLVPCSICMYVANFVPSLHWCSDTLLIVWITCTLLRYFRNYLFLMALCVFLQHCIHTVHRDSHQLEELFEEAPKQAVYVNNDQPWESKWGEQTCHCYHCHTFCIYFPYG